MSYRLPVAVLAAVAIAACTPKAQETATKASGVPAEADVAAVQQTIETANAEFMNALLQKDTLKAGANYAPDAMLFMPNEEVMVGKDAVQKDLVAFMKQFTVSNPHLKTEKVILAGSGDLAIENGTIEWTLTPAKGKPIQDRGKYVTVWQKQADGTWKIIRDISNSSLPM